MPIHTYSSRAFTREVCAAKRATGAGPVFITERGRLAFAVLKIDDYYRLAGQQEASLLEIMDRIPGSQGIDFDPHDMHVKFPAVKFDPD